MEQVRAAGDLGDMPLMVLASRNRLPVPAVEDARAVADFNADFAERVQPALARLSTRGRLVLLEGRADTTAITGAVRAVVDEGRLLRSPKRY